MALPVFVAVPVVLPQATAGKINNRNIAGISSRRITPPLSNTLNIPLTPQYPILGITFSEWGVWRTAVLHLPASQYWPSRQAARQDRYAPPSAGSVLTRYASGQNQPLRHPSGDRLRQSQVLRQEAGRVGQRLVRGLEQVPGKFFEVNDIIGV